MTQSKLGMGIIGTGLWGAHHAHVFSTLAQTALVAVCDTDAQQARDFAQTHGAEKTYTDYKELLADPAIDAVSVVTPDFAHAAIIADALAANKHILSEKPLATTVHEAERLHSAAAQSGLVCMIDFANRVSPAFVAAKASIAGGEIGLPQHITARLSNTTFVPLEMLSWADRSSALWFLGSHVVDLLRFLLEDEVERVFAITRKGILASRGVDTDDFHLALLEFRRGTVVSLENSWLLSPDNPSVVDFAVRIVGAEGQIEVNPSHSGVISKLTGEGLRHGELLGITPTAEGRIGGFVYEAIARFPDAVLRAVPPLASFHDGLVTTKVLAAIEQSARTGAAIDL